MRLTRHAWERWQERHPLLDLHAELANARRPSKRLRALLEAPGKCVVPERIWARRTYLITDNDVVFVLNDEGVVLTVLRLREARRWGRAKRKQARKTGTA